MALRMKKIYRVMLSLDINLLLLNLLIAGDRYNIMDSEVEVVEILSERGIYIQGLVTIYIISLAIFVTRLGTTVFMIYRPRRSLLLLHVIASTVGMILFAFQLSIYHSVFAGINSKVNTNGVDYAIGIMFITLHSIITMMDMIQIFIHFKESISSYYSFSNPLFNSKISGLRD